MKRKQRAVGPSTLLAAAQSRRSRGRALTEGVCVCEPLEPLAHTKTSRAELGVATRNWAAVCPARAQAPNTSQVCESRCWQHPHPWLGPCVLLSVLSVSRTASGLARALELRLAFADPRCVALRPAACSSQRGPH